MYYQGFFIWLPLKFKSQILDLLPFRGKHFLIPCFYIEALRLQIGLVEIMREF